VNVTGKGNKQRLVPIGRRALKEIKNYMPGRNSLPVIYEQNIIFLTAGEEGLPGQWFSP